MWHNFRVQYPHLKCYADIRNGSQSLANHLNQPGYHQSHDIILFYSAVSEQDITLQPRWPQSQILPEGVEMARGVKVPATVT